MNINLTAPALSANPVEFVQTNPGTLASDLATLSRDDFLYSGHRILNDLEQFNRASVDDELRLKLLDIYRANIINLAKTLRNDIGNSDLPVNKKLLTRLNIGLDLHRQLADGYKRIILNQHLSEVVEPSDNVLIIACERASFSILEIMTLSYLAYTPVPENAWKELHTIYDIANKKGFSTLSIPDEIDSSKALKISDIYLFALLLGLSEPYGLPNGSLHSLLPFFHIWIGYLSLFDKNNLDGLKYYFRIDPDMDLPFLPFPESSPVGDLYITTDLLAHQMLGPNPPLGSIDEEDAERISNAKRKLLPKLIKSWTNYPVRRYKRNETSGQIKLVYGLPNVINLINSGSRSGTRPDMDTMQTWKIANDSATGIGIEYTGHEVNNVHVGDIVLYKTDDMQNSDSWTTGIIRRFIHRDRSHLSLGIQRMPPNVQAGSLSMISPEEASGHGKSRVLMYPENTLLNTQATIISPSGTFLPGATYDVTLDNGRKFQVRAIKARESNPMIEQFSFEYMHE
jgi:hypothetical protein